MKSDEHDKDKLEHAVMTWERIRLEASCPATCEVADQTLKDLKEKLRALEREEEP